MAIILVVDDYAVNRELIVTLLRYRSHRTFEASDGAQALLQVREHQPDLVICDILMPTMDGFEFVRQLREDPATAGTNVIFCSAHFLEKEARDLARSCGVAHVVVKPFEPEEMLRVVENALGHAAPHEQPLVSQDFGREHLRLLTDSLAEKVDALQRTNQRLSALIDLNLRLASEREPNVLLDRVCRGAREHLGQRVNEAARDATQLAVIMFDVERFRHINDTLGRHTGDSLLKQVGARGHTFTAEPALFARLIGDQFALFISNVKGADNAARLLELGVRQVFGIPYRVADTELRLTATLGIAMYPGDGADAEALLRNAEVALKRAKTTRERYLFYTHQMSERVAGHLSLENRLRRAIERDEFVLHYQPKVDMESRALIGAEALLRWQSPDEGLVPPYQFIGLLEETGMILEVGAWVLRQAVADRQRWAAEGLPAPRVAVNVSAVQLRHRDFVDTVRRALSACTGPPMIDIELTESVVMEDVQASVVKLTAVRDMGLELAIDDFGTGYSSLGYLAKLPVRSLKIDRSFIMTMVDEADTMTLVETIISLAHSLRLGVIAEGVETESQASILQALHCDQMQGFLISRPVPAAAFGELLVPPDYQTAPGNGNRRAWG